MPRKKKQPAAPATPPVRQPVPTKHLCPWCQRAVDALVRCYEYSGRILKHLLVCAACSVLRTTIIVPQPSYAMNRQARRQWIHEQQRTARHRARWPVRPRPRFPIGYGIRAA